MKLFFYIGIILSMLSCLSGCSPLGHQSPRYEKIADEITAKTAKKLKKQNGLSLAGTGGQMMNDIQMMAMAFDFYKVVDIETARQLLVDSVQEYLSAINSNEEIRPYLHNYPFTARHVEVVIYFYNPDRSRVSPGKLNIADARRDKITYYTSDPEHHTIKPLHEENYEEALKLVEK